MPIPIEKIESLLKKNQNDMITTDKIEEVLKKLLSNAQK